MFEPRLTFEEYEARMMQGTVVDSSGYLYAWDGVQSGDVPREANTILAPKDYAFRMGVSVLNGYASNMSGRIERLPQNSLLFTTHHDFASSICTTLTTSAPAIHFLRPTGRGGFRAYYKAVDRSKPIIKWKVEDDEIVLQFGVWPQSQSEFVQRIQTCKDANQKALAQALLDPRLVPTNVYPPEGSMWFESYLNNLKRHLQRTHSQESVDLATTVVMNFEQVREQICDICIEPRSGYVRLPLVQHQNDTKWVRTLGIYMKDAGDRTVNIEEKFECRDAMFAFDVEEAVFIPTKNGLSHTIHDVKQVILDGTTMKATLKNGTTVAWDAEPVMPCNKMLKHYLHNLIHQKSKTVQSLSADITSGSNIHLKSLTETNHEYVYTTDDGLRTGIPLLHNHYDRFRYTSVAMPSNVAGYRNLFENVAALDLLEEVDAIKNQDAQNFEESMRSYLLKWINRCLELHNEGDVPEMLVAYFKQSDVPNGDVGRKLVIMRCMLMIVFKLLPVACPNIIDYPVYEHSRLLKMDESYEILHESSVCIDGHAVPLHYNAKDDTFFGRAAKNSITLNAWKLLPNEFKDNFVPAPPESMVNVQLEKVGKHVKTKRITHQTWTSSTIFSYAGKRYVNRLKPLQYKDNSEDEYIEVQLSHRLYELADSIGIEFENERVKYLDNRRFHHPLTLACPTSPVYKSTRDSEYQLMLRPFPTRDDLKSMELYCATHTLIFQHYSKPCQT